MTNIYVDGACINNGKPNAIAGYAIYFNKDDERNEYARVKGKQSNNTGELTAIIRALEISKDINEINIYTDSEYVIKCLTTFGKKNSKNDWKDEIKNKDLVKLAYELFTSRKNVKLNYIEAHTDKEDEHSIGNAEADRLAKLSIGLIETSEHKPKNIMLDWIGFDTKDKAKSLGAKWNIKSKYWYIEDTVSKSVLDELYKLKKDVIVLDWITYFTKDKAKALGAKWNVKEKHWYIEANVSKDILEELYKLCVNKNNK